MDQDHKTEILEQSVAGYGPQAVAMQPRLLAAIVYSTAVGRRLNRDVLHRREPWTKPR